MECLDFSFLLRSRNLLACSLSWCARSLRARLRSLGRRGVPIYLILGWGFTFLSNSNLGNSSMR